MIYIETTDEVSITLTRSILDTSINDGDDEFFVLVDGEEVDFEEIKHEDRTLIIDFLAGTEQIIGTFGSEFGTITYDVSILVLNICNLYQNQTYS